MYLSSLESSNRSSTSTRESRVRREGKEKKDASPMQTFVILTPESNARTNSARIRLKALTDCGGLKMHEFSHGLDFSKTADSKLIVSKTGGKRAISSMSSRRSMKKDKYPDSPHAVTPEICYKAKALLSRPQSLTDLSKFKSGIPSVLPSFAESAKDKWESMVKVLHQYGASLRYNDLSPVAELREPNGEKLSKAVGYICLLWGVSNTWESARKILFHEVIVLQKFIQEVQPLVLPIRRIRNAFNYGLTAMDLKAPRQVEDSGSASDAKADMAELLGDAAHKSTSDMLWSWVCVFQQLARLILYVDNSHNKQKSRPGTCSSIVYPSAYSTHPSPSGEVPIANITSGRLDASNPIQQRLSFDSSLSVQLFSPKVRRLFLGLESDKAVSFFTELARRSDTLSLDRVVGHIVSGNRDLPFDLEIFTPDSSVSSAYSGGFGVEAGAPYFPPAIRVGGGAAAAGQRLDEISEGGSSQGEQEQNIHPISALLIDILMNDADLSPSFLKGVRDKLKTVEPSVASETIDRVFSSDEACSLLYRVAQRASEDPVAISGLLALLRDLCRHVTLFSNRLISHGISHPSESIVAFLVEQIKYALPAENIGNISNSEDGRSADTLASEDTFVVAMKLLTSFCQRSLQARRQILGTGIVAFLGSDIRQYKLDYNATVLVNAICFIRSHAVLDFLSALCSPQLSAPTSGEAAAERSGCRGDEVAVEVELYDYCLHVSEAAALLVSLMAHEMKEVCLKTCIVVCTLLSQADDSARGFPIMTAVCSAGAHVQALKLLASMSPVSSSSPSAATASAAILDVSRKEAAARVDFKLRSCLLRTLGNTIAASDVYAQTLHELQLLSFVLPLCDERTHGQIIARTACWVIANVTAGTPALMRQFFESSAPLKLSAVVVTACSRDVQQEALIAISNALVSGSTSQVLLMACAADGDVSVLQAVAFALECNPERDPESVLAALVALHKILNTLHTLSLLNIAEMPRRQSETCDSDGVTAAELATSAEKAQALLQRCQIEEKLQALSLWLVKDSGSCAAAEMEIFRVAKAKALDLLRGFFNRDTGTGVGAVYITTQGAMQHEIGRSGGWEQATSRERGPGKILELGTSRSGGGKRRQLAALVDGFVSALLSVCLAELNAFEAVTQTENLITVDVSRSEAEERWLMPQAQPQLPPGDSGSSNLLLPSSPALECGGEDYLQPSHSENLTLAELSEVSSSTPQAEEYTPLPLCTKRADDENDDNVLDRLMSILRGAWPWSDDDEEEAQEEESSPRSRNSEAALLRSPSEYIADVKTSLLEQSTPLNLAFVALPTV